MIIEFLINAIITIIKLPFYLINIPSIDFEGFFSALIPYIHTACSFVRFFFDDFALVIIELALGTIVLFKVVDVISTIVGFFKKTGGSKD